VESLSIIKNKIISFIPPPFDREVRRIRQKLKDEFLLGIDEYEYAPFFVWQEMQGSNQDLLSSIEHVAYRAGILEIRTMGLCAKTGKEPELCIPIVKSPLLQDIHALITSKLQSAVVDSKVFIHTDEWFPHILLASCELTPENVYNATLWLSEQNLNWEFPVDHLAVIKLAKNGGEAIFHKFPFTLR